MPKFYLSTRVETHRPVLGKFTFEQCQFFAPTSSWWGVYASEDPAEIEVLDEAVKINAIEEITQEECQTWLAKKKIPSSSHVITVINSRPAPIEVGAPKPAVVAAPAAAKPAVETLTEVLSTAPAPKTKK